MDRQKLLDWKKSFLQTIADKNDKTELENGFEELVKNLPEKEAAQALSYLQLWENAQTDAEKFYFSKKTASVIIGKPV